MILHISRLRGGNEASSRLESPDPQRAVVPRDYISLWLTAPKGATAVIYTCATDGQVAARRDNVIIITLRQV